MTDRLTLVNIQTYHLDTTATETLRFCTGAGLNTESTDTPANARYAPRIKALPSVRRSLFAGGSTRGRSSIGFGALEVVNTDGIYDDFMRRAVDGRTYQQLQGIRGGAIPADFEETLNITMEQAELTRDTLRIFMRDLMAPMELPIQPNKYVGTGNLEGGDDIVGKPKPLVFGSVKNITVVLVDAAKLIYQVHDGLVAEIPAVYDKGISLGAGFPPVQRTSPLTKLLRGAASDGAGNWVAVGDDGDLAESSDNGTTWTVRTSGFGATDNITSVAFGNGVWVTVGESGKLFTSTDRVTWTSRTSGFGASFISDVAYSPTLALWVAVGQSAKLYTAPDPTSTWTSRTSGFTATDIFGVSWGNGRFVISGGSGKIAYSTNGTSWTLVSDTGVSTTLNKSVYGAGRFVVIGNAGVVLSSQYGTSWVQHPTPPGVTDMYGVSFGDGTYCVTGDTGYVATTVDLYTWVRQTSSFAAADICARPAYGDGVFVIVGSSGKIASTSTNGSYASEADLLDDALSPAPGCFKVYLSTDGSYFRLGSKPVGQVTADVLEGSNAAARTAAQLWARALDERCGLTSGDWSGSDVTARDSDNAAVCGVFVGTQETSRAAVLDAIVSGPGFQWWVDRSGTYRLTRFEAPSGSAVLSLVEADIKDFERETTTDDDRGIPPYRTTLRYQRNYTVQTDVLGGVTDERRAFLAEEWRSVSDTDSSVQTAHLLAGEIVEETSLQDADDAADEAERRQDLRGVKRDRFSFLAAGLTDAEVVGVDLNDVIDITHSRFGFESGELCRVLAIETTDRPDVLRFEVWK